MFRYLLLLVLFYSPVLMAEKWTVATLEWPPFTCEKCPDQGAAAKALKDVMKEVNVEVEFEFLPWSRALLDGKNKKYVGVFPVWRESVSSPYKISPLLFTSPVGFIEPANKKIHIAKLDDLAGKTVGIVQDYGHLEAFYKLVKEDKIKTQVVLRDELNIKKIYANRIDAAVIDINNAKYFLTHDYKNLALNVSINPFIIEKKGLFLSINDHESQLKKDKLNSALKRGNYQKIVDQWLKKYMSNN